MSDHAHIWSPIPGETARYSCECGQTGFRASSGEIREHKQKPPMAARWTARDHWVDSQGRVPRKPGAE